jgi:hypothetical protein
VIKLRQTDVILFICFRHLQFVIATAHLYADNNKISVPKPVDIQQITKIIADVKVPSFVPSNKVN